MSKSISNTSYFETQIYFQIFHDISRLFRDSGGVDLMITNVALSGVALGGLAQPSQVAVSPGSAAPAGPGCPGPQEVLGAGCWLVVTGR